MDTTKDSKDNKRTAKRKMIALHDFKDKFGKEYKKGERIEIDEEYAPDLIHRGDANNEDDPTASQLPAPEHSGRGDRASQLPADQPHGDRGAHASQPIAKEDRDQKHRDSK